MPLQSTYITLLCGGYETKCSKVFCISGMKYFEKNRYLEEKRRDIKIILKLISLEKYVVYNVIN
jgi:hypothetical protein